MFGSGAVVCVCKWVNRIVTVKRYEPLRKVENIYIGIRHLPFVVNTHVVVPDCGWE